MTQQRPVQPATAGPAVLIDATATTAPVRAKVTATAKTILRIFSSFATSL
jgi:hypothetical protein